MKKVALTSRRLFMFSAILFAVSYIGGMFFPFSTTTSLEVLSDPTFVPEYTMAQYMYDTFLNASAIGGLILLVLGLISKE